MIDDATSRPCAPMRRARRIGALTLTLFVAIFLTAAAAQETDTAAETETLEEQTDTVVSVDPSARDIQIQQRIDQILDATGWYQSAEVSVDKGVVFLTGEAANDARREWAGSLARRTEGVVAVVNKLTLPSAPFWSLEPALKELDALRRNVVSTAPLIVIALVILPLAWFAARAVATLARRVQHGGDRSPFLQDLIARAVAAPVFLFGLYLVLQVAGLTQLALSLLGGAGVLGIIFGFAFRDIAENFLASILLSVRRPFQRGDFIDVAGESGAVRSMNTRTTVLESIEGNLIQIPNAVIFKSTIINYTASPARQGTLDVGVGYDASIAEAQTVIADVLRDHGAVMADPEPYVLVDALGASTVNLRGYYWFNGHEYSLLKVRSALLRLVKKALMEREISMPDDAREVIFPDGVPLRKIADEPGDARAAAPSAPDAPPVEPSEDATEAEGELQTEQAASDPRNHRPVDGGGGDLLSG